MALRTSEGDTHAALVASAGFLRTSNGFVGTSDGWTDLEADRRLDSDHDTATDGNVLQTGELRLAGRTTTHTLALGFAGSDGAAEQTARASLAAGFTGRATAYRGEWHRYLDSLRPVPAALTGRLRTQYTVAVMTVKAHEDKTFRGAFIASLTLPWGFAVNADTGGGGYHFVWARDLYHQVTGLLAAGDRAAADRAVSWLFQRQQQPDGTFPQNSRVDGEPDQRNIQLDETAFPLVLAYQLRRTDLWDGVRRAAEALVRLGPSTPQERWEETGGYSPSTTAAEIAGLVAAAKIAAWRGDRLRERLWLGVADEWQRNTEEWMFTTTGAYGDGRYYLRINADTDPNDDDARDWGNAAGVHPEKEVVDAGFLELVRLGVKAPGDRYVRASLAETDASLATDTPSGRVWHRYTFDGYGEKDTGEPWTFNTPGTEGRAWPLLSGERGEYVVANGGNGLPYLRTMANTANDGYMIPEQVWDEDQPAPAPYGYQPGKATGSASPLAWAMAQYVRLARAIEAGRPVETPAAVRARYAAGDLADPPSLELTAPADGSIAPSSEVVVRGTTDAARVYVGAGDDVVEVVPRNGTFEATIGLDRGGNVITVVGWTRTGGTAMRQVTVASYGTRIGGFTDPAGDDDGPGTYVYPTCSCFNPGAFDLTALDVYADGDDVLFVARIAGEVLNPFGGDQISLQRLNVYLGTAPDGPQPALPGTNMDTAGPWQLAVVGDGRFDQAGLYAPDGTKVAAAELLAVPRTRQIAVAVPRVGARRHRPRRRAVRDGDARQRRGERGRRLRAAGLLARLLDRPAGGLRVGHPVPLRRRRRRGRPRGAEPGHRHPRPERARRHRRPRTVAGAGARLDGGVARPAAHAAAADLTGRLFVITSGRESDGRRHLPASSASQYAACGTPRPGADARRGNEGPDQVASGGGRGPGGGRPRRVGRGGAGGGRVDPVQRAGLLEDRGLPARLDPGRCGRDPPARRPERLRGRRDRGRRRVHRRQPRPVRRGDLAVHDR